MKSLRKEKGDSLYANSTWPSSSYLEIKVNAQSSKTTLLPIWRRKTTVVTKLMIKLILISLGPGFQPRYIDLTNCQLDLICHVREAGKLPTSVQEWRQCSLSGFRKGELQEWRKICKIQPKREEQCGCTSALEICKPNPALWRFLRI